MADDPVQRSGPRFAVDASITIISKEGQQTGSCVNLSSGGLCAECTDALPLGREVELSLTLVFAEDSFSEPLRLPARSVWCTPIGDVFQVGFQFLPHGADTRSFLAMFLRYLDEGRAAGEG